MANKKGYTDPKLHDGNGDLKKEWFVSFRYTNPATGVRKPFQFRMGINYLHTKAERYDEGKAVVGLLKNALQTGWNPFEEKFDDYAVRVNEQADDEINIDYSKMPFNDAMKFAAEQMESKLAPKSYQGYESARNFALEAAKKIKMDALPVGEVKRKHIKLLLTQIGKDRQAEYDAEGKGQQFTGNNYNKYKRALSSHFTELFELDAIEYNPCHKIAKRQEISTDIHRQPVQEEEEQIKDYLKKVKPKFFVFLAIEALAGMRPKEIYGLRISDLKRNIQCFQMHATAGRSKTKKARIVAIPNTLLKYLDWLELDKYPEDMYIFGRDFEPGYQLQHRQRATEAWKMLVKDELGINVSLYSFKGLGGEKKRTAGIETKTVQSSFGHTDIKTTEIYLPTEADRRRKEIIENTPDF